MSNRGLVYPDLGFIALLLQLGAQDDELAAIDDATRGLYMGNDMPQLVKRLRMVIADVRVKRE